MSRIAIVTPGLDGRAGGVERFSILLRDALTPEHEVSVVEVRPVTTRVSAAGWWQESRAVARRLRTIDVDLIITGTTVGSGFDRLTPRIHVCHGTMVSNARSAVGEPWRARASTAFGAGLAERSATRHARLVAVSRATAHDLRHDYALRRAVTVLENGVDTGVFAPHDRNEARSRFSWLPDERVALFVGRPERRKGIDIAVNAAQRAGVRLVVAGPRAAVGADWLGLLHPEDLALAYAGADFTVFPTRYEACSYAILEAIACKARLLTTRVGWMADIAQRRSEFDRLLLPRTVDAFAEALAAPTTPTTSEQDARTALHQLVLAENSLAVFGRRWRELVRDMLKGKAIA